MCGIAAIFAYDERAPAVEPGELRSIRERMTRRGPDGAGEWLSPNHRLGLAHRRLSIIDLSDAGAQPMTDASGCLRIVFNGEIYNYRELRAELEATGVRFRSHSDTEVLLHLFARDGEDMLVRLRGMFAFALWDALRGKLFLARDPFGIKPLYYADDGRTLRVASQVKALLAGGAIDTAPDPAGHVGFHLWGHVPEPFTLFRGVRQLPAGTCLWADAAGCGRPKAFCDIAQILAEAGRTPAAAASGTGSLTDAVADSVTHHLIADVPVGVFLSAGLDSTTLARSVSVQGADLRTVTLGFEEFRGTPQDEAPWAERVAAQLGARHQTIRVTRSDFTSHFEDLLDQMDQPTTDGVNSYFVSLAARRAGLKVALSGLGADEILGGYPSFTELPQAVRTFGWSRRLPALGRGFRVVAAPVLSRCTSPKYAGLLEYGGTHGGAYLLRRGMFMPWELPHLLDPDLVRAGWESLRPLAALESVAAPPHLDRLKVSALEGSFYMRNQLLRDTDWASMAHSLEVRVPFVDVPFWKAAAREVVAGRPAGKRDLAAALSPPLPVGLLDRPKSGFTVPVREWLVASSPERETSPLARRGLRRWARTVYDRFVTAS